MIREAVFILGLATGILAFMVSRPATEPTPVVEHTYMVIDFTSIGGQPVTVKCGAGRNCS
jgi:hypothetical protein